MAGGAPAGDPMEVEKVLDDTENDSDTAAGEGDAPEGVAASKGSWRKPSKKAKITLIQKHAALHHNLRAPSVRRRLRLSLRLESYRGSSLVRNRPPLRPSVGLCLGPYGGLRWVSCFL